MFSTQDLIRMTSGRIEMLETALVTGDYRPTAMSSREVIEYHLTKNRESLAALRSRAPEPCYYCGLPTGRDGSCVECGTVPSMLASL